MVNELLWNANNVSPDGRKVKQLLVVQHCKDIPLVQQRYRIEHVVAINNSASRKRRVSHVSPEQVDLIRKLVFEGGAVFIASKDTADGERAALEVFRAIGSTQSVGWLKIRQGETLIDIVGELPYTFFRCE